MALLAVNDQFIGNGYTKGPDGVAEYLLPNRNLAELPGAVVIELTVSYPDECCANGAAAPLP